MEAKPKRTLQKKQTYKPKADRLPEACPICSRIEILVWDHVHASGFFRGYICHRCNVALGLLDDDVRRLRKAIEYLESKMIARNVA